MVRKKWTLDPIGYSGTYDFIGGHLILDFCNTVSNRGGEAQHDWLSSYANLLAWSVTGGLLERQQSERLAAIAAQRPQIASQALDKAIILRELLYRIFSAAAERKAAAPEDLQALSRLAAAAVNHHQLAARGGQYAWQPKAKSIELDEMLWFLAWQAAEFLTSPQFRHVGKCQGLHCGWLFLDQSKNHSRRWCSMDDCGNREKARRFYKRNLAVS